MEKQIWKYLEEVADPEIPVISVVDLGIIRAIRTESGGRVHITLTPTYLGCPAMQDIKTAIRLKMHEKGIHKIEIEEKLNPAWTTEDISEVGKEKMSAFGIAPPRTKVSAGKLFEEEEGIPCPRCQSENTQLISQFGSTACKALYQCQTCKEPFDYFKCHH
jgi:ring-1,2-phenylacetyl-CoA epoxidase subunit PaaD